jgi:hypothetical protein
VVAGIGLGISLGIPSVIGLCLNTNTFNFPQQVVITLYLPPLTMTENLLPAFNGQLDLRIAYNWNQSEVSFPDMRLIYTKTATNLIRSMIFSKMSSIIMPFMVYPRKEGLSW